MCVVWWWKVFENAGRRGDASRGLCEREAAVNPQTRRAVLAALFGLCLCLHPAVLPN